MLREKFINRSCCGILGRRTSEQWIGADGATVLRTIGYTYNDKGQLTNVSDPDSSYTYTYDDAGRVTSVDNTGTPSLPSVVLTQSYDGFGNRTSLGTSVAGTTQLTNGYQYGALGRMTALTQSGSAVASKGAGFTYNALGQLTAVDGYASTNQTGLVYSAAYGYDAAGRLTSLGYISAADANLAGYVYTYDADGRMTGETNVDGTVAYAYDADSRLTAATGDGLTAAESYAYDATGNRTDAGDATSSGNRLASDGTYDYAYDADGNLLTKTTVATGATTTYTWDYRNRLTDVTDRTAGGTVTGHVHYTYDVFDRRIGQQVDGDGDGTYDSVERYVYDGDDLLLTLGGTGAVTHAYLNGPGSNQVLADDAGGSGLTWLLADRLDSVRDVISSSGTIVDHLQYDSYGNVTAQSNAADQPRFGYAGMQLDATTGLYYDNARYYDARTGTFISQDPSGFAGGNANLYGYVNNDPTNLVDPLGLWSIAKFIYTGDGNASDEVYSAATQAAGSWQLANSPVRGFYGNVTFTDGNPLGSGRSLDVGVSGGVSWTMDQGWGVSVEGGAGLAQEYGTKGFYDYSNEVGGGAAGGYQWTQSGSGPYSGVIATSDGAQFGWSGGQIYLGFGVGGENVNAGGGLIIDPAQFANSGFWEGNWDAVKNIARSASSEASTIWKSVSSSAGAAWQWTKNAASSGGLK